MDLPLPGLSRNVSWGLYIAQFTFFVGIAASAVMVVLPYYLHDVQEFDRITILGEMLAVSAVTMCMLFIFVDMGQPARVLNVMLSPDAALDHVLGHGLAQRLSAAERRDRLRDADARSATNCRRRAGSEPVILISIPWAVSIHTVTAFLYSGLPGRTFWMTAILAPRFLASAFAAGPSLLILLCLLLRRITKFDVGDEALRKLGIIVAYAMSINVFFVLLEVFTSFYSGIPRDTESFRFLFAGLDGDFQMVPWMWTSVTLLRSRWYCCSCPSCVARNSLLAIAAMLVFISLWIEKGVGLIVGGFVPSPLGAVTRYSPTAPEWGIVVGVWAIGALLITVFYKITVTVREVR